MSGHFHADMHADESLLAETEAAAPENPFFTIAYRRARQQLGETAMVLYVDGVAGREICPAFLRAGRLTRAIEIPSGFAFSPEFVAGLIGTCRAERVSALEINTYGSPAGAIPPVPHETARIPRCEYVIDLREPDLLKPMSKTHRQRARQGEKAGLVLRRSRDDDARRAHIDMMEASMRRRAERGEDVSIVRDAEWATAYLACGAGELFQAMQGDVAVSSMLLLRSRLAGYDQSSGSLPEGMSVGAAHFLIHQAASELQREGAHVLNLGGARESESGLRSFKSHFGAHTVDLELVECRPPTGLVHGSMLRASGALRGTASVASAAIARLRGATADSGSDKPPVQ